MPTLIEKPSRFPQEAIVIEEFFGKISDKQSAFSLGRLSSGEGWSEPAQRPDFDEYSLVLSGALYITAEDGSVTIVRGGQAAVVRKGERIQYSTPEPGGAEYISLCIPAFVPELAHRDPL